MEDKRKEQKSQKKMKYVEPELVSLDDDHVAEGGFPPFCRDGSGNPTECSSGAGGKAV